MNQLWFFFCLFVLYIYYNFLMFKYIVKKDIIKEKRWHNMVQSQDLYDYSINKWEETLEKWKTNGDEEYEEWMETKHFYKLDTVAIKDQGEQILRDYYSDKALKKRKFKLITFTLKENSMIYTFPIYFSPEQNDWVTTQFAAFHQGRNCSVCNHFGRYNEKQDGYNEYCMIETFGLKFLLDQIKTRHECRLRLLLNK